MKGSITLVDDCTELLRLLALFLEDSLRISCLCLTSLSEVQQQAVAVLEGQAVILDIILGPGQPDGVAVYRWLMERGYRGKVFFLTGHAKDSPSMRDAVQTGVTILEKPMAIHDLVPRIERSLSTDSRVVV